MVTSPEPTASVPVTVYHVTSQTKGLFIPHRKMTAEALADSSHPKTTTDAEKKV